MLVAERNRGNQNFDHWDKEQASETIAYDPRECKWRCPLCKEQVTWVKKGSDGTIAHFRHKNSAQHPSISESKLHNKAKKTIKQKLEKDNNLEKSELEKVVGNYEKNNYQVADIFLETEDGEKIAVEIQCSNQTVEDFKDRTRFYNNKNISVIWILEKENFIPEKSTCKTHHKDTLLFKESVKWVQSNWYGRCYILTEDFSIIPYRLRRTQVTRRSPEHGEYKTRLKTVAEYSKGEINNYGILLPDSDKYKIARFYDKVWWN
jgi:competence CoiA-like predicted nuclease